MREIGFEFEVIDSALQFKEISAPATPFDNKLKIYAKDKSGTSALYLKDDAGSEREIANSATITGAGTDNQLAIWNGTGAIDAFALTTGSILFGGAGNIAAQDNSTLFWNNTDKSLIIGAASAPASAIAARGLHVVKTATVAELVAYGYSGTGTQVGLRLLKPRGTPGSETASQSGDGGFIAFGGHDGTNFVFTAADILGTAAENWTASAQGSQLQFRTIATGSTTLTERFRIGPAGQLGIGGATYGTSGQAFLSGGASAAPAWTSLDHGTHLAGLTDDDHTQYVLNAGTREQNAAYFTERADHVNTPAAGKGEVWVRSDTPNVLVFTDDAGTDTVLGSGGGSPGGSDTQIQFNDSSSFGGSANLTWDGTDLALGSGNRFRMQSQNRIRYLNSTAKAIKTTSANQTSLTQGTFVTVTLDSEEYDTDTLHDNSTNNSRLTAALTGKYLISANIRMDGSGVTSLTTAQSRIIRDGSASDILASFANRDTVSSAYQFNLTTIAELTAGQYVELQGLCGGSSGTFAISVTVDGQCNLAIVYIGE